MRSRKADIEVELRALFDAHERICQARAAVLDQYEDPETRGAVIDSFRQASHRITETAIDRTHRQVELLEEDDD